MDSTGVPHILEHTVLCGSYRFPCRDPFFNMLNRSLATFMNAFTGKIYLNLTDNCSQHRHMDVDSVFSCHVAFVVLYLVKIDQ